MRMSSIIVPVLGFVLGSVWILFRPALSPVTPVRSHWSFEPVESDTGEDTLSCATGVFKIRLGDFDEDPPLSVLSSLTCLKSIGIPRAPTVDLRGLEHYAFVLKFKTSQPLDLDIPLSLVTKTRTIPFVWKVRKSSPLLDSELLVVGTPNNSLPAPKTDKPLHSIVEVDVN